MTDDSRTGLPFDEYTDMFTVSITPFGAYLSFAVREPHPRPGGAPNPRQLGTLRMSVEHMKTLVVILRNQIRKAEAETGVRADVPRNILNQLNIAAEDWDAFWQ